MKIRQSFTTPKLCTCKNDISKDWFIYFYFTDPSTRKKKLFRYKLGINRLKTKKEREEESSHIIYLLLERLKSGWNPITNDIKGEETPEDKTVPECFDEILELKKAYITKESLRTFNNQSKIFKKWLERKKIEHLFVQNFTRTHAQKYLDYLLKERKYSGKTYNVHLSFLRNFFNSIKERGYITDNPFDGFPAVRQERGKNNAYLEAEERLVVDYLKLHNPRFYLATRFVKYLFLRRTELGRLQVKHINWSNKTVTIPSSNAKNRIQDSVTIPQSLEKLIIEFGILNNPANAYIFGTKGNMFDFKTSLNKIGKNDYFTDYQRKVNRKLGIRSECTFYSWKHTGAVQLYNLTKDPYVVMRQCRHSNIEMTMIYLRSLGCGVNEHVRAW